MSEHTRTVFTGLSCDANGCDARVTGPEMPRIDGREHYTRRAVADGWTVWVGNSTRHYCPEHQPARGHQMREATRYYRQESTR